MNPLLLLAALGVGVALLSKKSDQTAQPSAAVKLPTGEQPGSVAVQVPQVTLQPPQVVTLPEVTITSNPENKYLGLSVDEQLLLEQGTADAIYAEGIDSNHESFVAAAGLVLSGKGDPRTDELTARVLNWPKS